MMNYVSDSSRRSTDWMALTAIEVLHGCTVNTLWCSTLLSQEIAHKAGKDHVREMDREDDDDRNSSARL